jgi:predicted GNAT superfamily acetyltransferase
VIGAFDGHRLVGFAMALPGTRGEVEPVPHLHSHMLAVAADYRDCGIGRRLKLYQRAEALPRNLELMEWTFDPLEIKNAFLNIHRLGAIVRRYTANFYGVSSSRLQGGLPTDRLHAEWHLRTQRVEAALNGSSAGLKKIEETIEEEITVPQATGEWRASKVDFSRALAVQAENRQRFQSAFARGLGGDGLQAGRTRQRNLRTSRMD